MISISIDDDCFVKIAGRIFRGVAVRFWESENQVQVKTDAARLVYHPWTCMSFRLYDGKGDAARDAELIVPTTLADWAKYGELADSGHVEPGYRRRIMAQEKPLPLGLPDPVPVAIDVAPTIPKRVMASEPPRPASFLPYADDDDDKRVMKAPADLLPEGYEEGEPIP